MHYFLLFLQICFTVCILSVHEIWWSSNHFSQDNLDNLGGEVLPKAVFYFFIVISLFNPAYHFPELIFQGQSFLFPFCCVNIYSGRVTKSRWSDHRKLEASHLVSGKPLPLCRWLDSYAGIDTRHGRRCPNIQGGSNITGTDLCVNKPHCAAAVRPWDSEATTSTLPPARVRTCSVLSGSC